jgi:hypothetical protein
MKTAQGSLKELETHLILAQLLGYGNYDLAEQLLARCESVGRMLHAPFEAFNVHWSGNMSQRARTAPIHHGLLPTAYCPNRSRP